MDAAASERISEYASSYGSVADFSGQIEELRRSQGIGILTMHRTHIPVPNHARENVNLVPVCLAKRVWGLYADETLARCQIPICLFLLHTLKVM